MFKMEFATDNAAFEHNPEDEVFRILKVVAARARNGEMGGKVKDVNGNVVGQWSVWYDSGDSAE